MTNRDSMKRGRAAAWRPLGYGPSDRQRTAHDSQSRLTLVAGGERAWQSRSSAMELVWQLRAARLFWIVGPDYEQRRPELQYVIDSLYAVDDIKTMSGPARGPCVVVTKTGSRIVTKSARSPERLAGEAPDGILLCEAAQCNYEVYLRLRGRVAEKRGWLSLSGTFEGSQNWYAEKFNQIWQAEAGIHLRFNRGGGLLDGIARLRTYLEDPATGEPRIIFDPKCVMTIREFGKYQYRGGLEGRPIPEEPIDRDNHALKALSYWLVDRFGSTRRRRRALMDFRMV